LVLLSPEPPLGTSLRATCNLARVPDIPGETSAVVQTIHYAVKKHMMRVALDGD
jgi:hypothetical protein